MNQKKLLFFSVVISLCMASCQGVRTTKVVRLTCDRMEQPAGIENRHPVLGWQIASERRGAAQTAYRILVAATPEDLAAEKGTLWDSGKITSSRSIHIPYAGAPLESGKQYFWKVKIWDEKGRESAWSKPSGWQTGLFTTADWSGARWIAYELSDPALRLVPGIHGMGNNLGDKAVKRPVVPLFRKPFQVNGKLTAATLSVSGMGHYEAFVNGQKAGNAFLAPGWTDYDKTVFYNTYDVTALLTPGENVLGAMVGNGFYNINRERYRKLVIAFGMPEMIARLQLNYADGRTETVVTDASWKSSPSPITFSSIYSGEDYDASLEQPGWDQPGFDDSGWQAVQLSNGPAGRLTAEKDYPLQEMQTIPATQIIRLKDGSYLYDFGQNASGIIELTVQGKPGSQVTLWPAELINPDSTCNQRASGSPYYFAYTLKGGPAETWKPRFTYYGFRYVQVFGAVPAGETVAGDLPVIEKLNLVHTRNSAPANGTFTCSNELLNQIHSLIDWAIRSNFQSVLTDCPHREKLGWLEQTFLMGAGVHFRYENYHLYQKLVYDMMDAQTEDGLVPDIAPEYVEFQDGFRDSPEWGSAAVILPWLLWKWYGDEEIIDQAWPMMLKYVNYLKGKSSDHILSHGLGDWFDLGPNSHGIAQLTPVALTATAIYYYDVKLMAEMAATRQINDHEMLAGWAEEIRTAFNARFYNPETGVYATGSQTAQSMPLCLGIVPEADRTKVFSNLLDTIAAGNKALTAGDVGFHYLVEALTTGGASQLMFEMINRDDVPGYGFQLKKGATALTESWQALEVVSNNHLMLGHVMEWFYAGLAGIGQTTTSTAYKEIEIKPEVTGDLTFVKAGFQSPYGLIRSEWTRNDRQFELEVEIPANTTARIVLPPILPSTVKIDGKKPGHTIPLSVDPTGKVNLQVGSGIYRISAELDF